MKHPHWQTSYESSSILPKRKNFHNQIIFYGLLVRNRSTASIQLIWHNFQIMYCFKQTTSNEKKRIQSCHFSVKLFDAKVGKFWKFKFIFFSFCFFWIAPFTKVLKNNRIRRKSVLYRRRVLSWYESNEHYKTKSVNYQAKAT